MSYSYSSQAYEFGSSSGGGAAAAAAGGNQVNQIAQDLLTLNRGAAGGGNIGVAEYSSFSSGGSSGAAGGFSAGFSSSGNAGGFSSGGAQLVSEEYSASYGGSSLGGAAQFGAGSGASQLVASNFGGSTSQFQSNGGASAQFSTQSSSAIGTGNYISEIEQLILRAQAPVQLNETEEITVNGERGIWANRQEVVNWRGVIPIEQYIINVDSNPEIITKRTAQALEYIQELAIRYLRPPTPPAPGEILIKQELNTLTPPAPPLIIRQQPARPSTPEPLVIREAPPQPPAQVGRKVITISGKRIPPPPRKVIVERLPQIPSKPQSLLVERWLPYAQVKRRVIFQGATQRDAVVVKPRNVIVQWEAPQVNIRKEVKYLGVIKANPAEYVQRYGATLKVARELPQFVLDIKTPDGLVLAADYQYNSLYELEGDIQAFKLVDLEREGLAEYRAYLQRLGITYNAAAAAAAASASFNASASYGGSAAGGLSSTSYGAGNGASAGFGAASSGFGVTSFSASSGSAAGGASNDLVEQIFKSLNRDNDNRISRSEAEKALLFINSRLGRNYGENEVNAFFQQLDTNGDGFLDIDELRKAFQRL